MPGSRSRNNGIRRNRSVSDLRRSAAPRHHHRPAKLPLSVGVLRSSGVRKDMSPMSQMPTIPRVAPQVAPQVADLVALMRGYSIETTPASAVRVGRFADHLAPGTTVNVTLLPGSEPEIGRAHV